jgi:hypothetical protein
MQTAEILTNYDVVIHWRNIGYRDAHLALSEDKVLCQRTF